MFNIFKFLILFIIWDWSLGNIWRPIFQLFRLLANAVQHWMKSWLIESWSNDWIVSCASCLHRLKRHQESGVVFWDDEVIFWGQTLSHVSRTSHTTFRKKVIFIYDNTPTRKTKMNILIRLFSKLLTACTPYINPN